MDRRIPAAVMLCVVSTSAWGNDVQSSWSGNVTVASQYVSRGFRQSWGRPALQGGVVYTTSAGWYAGSWLSTVSPYTIENGRVEMDVYAGKSGKLGDVSYHAGLYGYVYPGAEVTVAHARYNYSEFVAGVAWRQWSLSYSLTISRDYFGNNSKTLGIGSSAHSRGSGYLDLGRSFDLGKGYRLALHYGRQRINHFSDYDWQDASVTASHPFAGFDMAFVYSRAWNSHGVYQNVTTGVPDKSGRLHFSDPASGTWYFTISRDF